MKKSLLIIAVLSANLLLLNGCADDQARAQIADTNAKLLQLQNNIGVIDTKISNKRDLDLLNKINEMQAQIDQLNGQVSTLTYNQQNFQDTQTKLYQSLQQQIQGNESSITNIDNSNNSNNSNNKVTPNNTISVTNTNNTVQLHTALEKIKNHNYTGAIKDLKNILNAGSPQSKIASYYLSICYAANKQFKDAIIMGKKFATENPQNPNAADALRVVYISQTELGMAPAANKTAKLILDKYPTSEAAAKLKNAN